MPFELGLNFFSRVLVGLRTASPINESILANFSTPFLKPSQTLPATFATLPPKFVIPFHRLPKKPVPLANAFWFCIAIKRAVSLALRTSAPAGSNILVFLPGTIKWLPFGIKTISLLPVSGLSLPSFSSAKVGCVIALRWLLNKPVPFANLTSGILPIVCLGPPKSWIRSLIPSIPLFGIPITALIPSWANFFMLSQSFLNPSPMPFQVSSNFLTISLRLSNKIVVRFLPNLSLVELLILSHVEPKKSLAPSQCLFHSLPIAFEVSPIFLEMSLYFLPISFLVASQTMPDAFLVFSQCLLQALPIFFEVSPIDFATWLYFFETTFLIPSKVLPINLPVLPKNFLKFL